MQVQSHNLIYIFFILGNETGKCQHVKKYLFQFEYTSILYILYIIDTGSIYTGGFRNF